jgi:AAA ATPase domain
MVVGVQVVSEPEVVSRLRGRQAEIEALCDQLNAVRAGRGGTVLVAGLAGMGKTVLLDAAAVMARERGIRVYRGTGDAAARVISFGPLLGARSGELSTPARAALGRMAAAGALKITLTPLGENAVASALRELTACGVGQRTAAMLSHFRASERFYRPILAASEAGFYQYLEDRMAGHIADVLRSPQLGALVRPEDAGGIETLARFMAGGIIVFIRRWLAQPAEDAVSPAKATRQLERIIDPFLGSSSSPARHKDVRDEGTGH